MNFCKKTINEFVRKYTREKLFAPLKLLRFLSVILISVLILISTSALVYAANADEDSSPYVRGNLSVAKCIAKGNIDFGLFLTTFIYSDGFYDGIVEPWNDVLFRNKCHSLDISGLIRQQDKIRKYIRDAFLTCNNQKLPALEKAFDKLNIEIYYVRHLVDRKVISFLPFEVLNVQISGNPDSVFYSTEKLYSEMYKKYVNKTTLGPEEFDQLFSKLEFKYQDRKKEYAACKNDSWQQVVEKWEEFIDTAGGMGPAWDDAEKEVVGAVEKLVETTTDGGLEAWYSGRFQSNIGGMPSEPGFGGMWDNLTGQLGEEWDKQKPSAFFNFWGNLFKGTDPSGSANDSGLTQEAMLAAGESADYYYDLIQIHNELTTDFESLYLYTSNEGIGSIVSRLEKFNDTLISSLAPIEKVEDMADYMNSRQCEGKF